MKKIKLTQDQIAIVDNKNFYILDQYKWYSCKRENIYYAIRKDITNNKKHKTIFMHREVLQKKEKRLLKSQEITDHINGNGLDNRECNLRIATSSQSNMNRGSQRGSSIYKGVCWHKRDKKWVSYIALNGRSIHLGYFENEINAAKAYDLKAKELFGEFARLNFS